MKVDTTRVKMDVRGFPGPGDHQVFTDSKDAKWDRFHAIRLDGMPVFEQRIFASYSDKKNTVKKEKKTFCKKQKT
jgi:hypothetical protein